MKSWKKPEAIGQEFVANDYVSACSIAVACDFKTGESLHGGGLVVPDSVTEIDSDTGEPFAGGEYRPCNHEFVVDVELLKPLTFTHFTEGPDNVPLSKSYDAYYWVQNDGTDFHATSVSQAEVEAALSNKS